MPTNLNALIRYKTINEYLSTGMKCTIEDLMEACGEALGEYRGKYGPVSERTIREDIRVMRSDILGMNAPILQKNGLYFYSDRSYHLINVIFSGADIIQKVIKLLNDMNLKSPEVDDMIQQLRTVMVRKAPSKAPEGPEWYREEIEFGLPPVQEFRTFDSLPASRKAKVPKPAGLTWGDLFGVIMMGSKA